MSASTNDHINALNAGNFGVFPRFNGTAKVTVGASVDAEVIIRFATKKAAEATSLAAKDAEKESVQVTYETVNGKEVRVLTASLGEAAKVNAEGLQKAANAAVTKALSFKSASVEVALPTDIEGIPNEVTADIVTNAVILSNYKFDRYFTTKEKVSPLIGAINFTVGSSDLAAVVQKAATMAQCTIFTRDFVTERSDEMNPQRVEEIAQQIAAESGAKLHVLKGEDLVTEGLHLLHAVGQSARYPARYVELFHEGDPENPDDKILIVGKCITFDTGGLNLKGTGFMEDMHMDKGGAGAALGAFLALTRLGVKRNVVAVATVAENAIDSNSYKPKAIIRSHKGLTVEIGNTDAEGRLALADALSYGQVRHKPHTIIDLATLTGACVIALGEYAAGLFTNNNTLRDRLLASSQSRSERVWPLPMLQEHKDELKASPHADLQSTGAGRYGGACTAAGFLSYFIGGEGQKPVAWSHIDVAGPAMYSKARGYMPYGGTGFGAQLVADYVLKAPKGALPEDPVAKY